MSSWSCDPKFALGLSIVCRNGVSNTRGLPHTEPSVSRSRRFTSPPHPLCGLVIVTFRICILFFPQFGCPGSMVPRMNVPAETGLEIQPGGFRLFTTTRRPVILSTTVPVPRPTVASADASRTIRDPRAHRRHGSRVPLSSQLNRCTPSQVWFSF